MAKLNKSLSRALVGGAFFLVAGLIASHHSLAELKAFSLGVSAPTPMGDVAQSLNRPVGFQAEGWVGAPSWLPANSDLHFALNYLPFAARNQADSSLRMIGIFAGLQATGGVTFLGISPFLALDLGGVYSALSFANASGATTNSSLRFATQIVPGVDFTIFRNLGGIIELPVAVVFQESTLVLWNGSFSLRWKL